MESLEKTSTTHKEVYQVGVDIGGSHITACLYDAQWGELIANSMVTRYPNPDSAAESLLDEWAETIAGAMQQSPCGIKGVGIAVPGPFDYAQGISQITGVNKFECLYGINIKEELSKRLDLRKNQIRFVNDAAAFGMAVSMEGQAKCMERCVAITLGTGLGSSFLVAGVPVISGDEVPENGWLYNADFQGEMADDHFSARGLVKRFKSLGGKAASTALEVFHLADSDPTARETFISFGSDLGRFLNSFLHKFGADILVLGGNLSRAFPYFGPALSRELAIPDVMVSSILDRAPLIGGAMLMDEEYYKNIAGAINNMK